MLGSSHSLHGYEYEQKMSALKDSLCCGHHTYRKYFIAQLQVESALIACLFYHIGYLLTNLVSPSRISQVRFEVLPTALIKI